MSLPRLKKMGVQCGLCLVLLLGPGICPAMKALSDGDLGGVSGMAGLSIYAQDLDATLLQMDDFLIDLSPDPALADWQFLIVDDSKSQSLFSTNDGNSIAAALCGSPTDESVPIDVDVLGFDIEAGTGDLSSDGLMNNDAVTFSMTGYGSTDFHYVWELVQFQNADTTYDVFGFHIGEIFWVDEYSDPDPKHFAQLFMTPPSHYGDGAFFDSFMSDWGGLTDADIRSNQGIAGELRLKLGGGELNFRGFGVEAKGSSIMMAGDIIDDPYFNGTNTVFPNHRTVDASAGHYYSHSVEDWYIIGDFAVGVHHARTHDTSGYTYPDYAASQIGQSSATLHIRLEIATADYPTYDADGDFKPDTYLVTYVHGHYSRTVYYPESAISSMGRSTGAVQTPANGLWKEYIIGEVRIGETGWATSNKDGSTEADPNVRNESVPNVGSWALNDCAMVYTKAVIPGQRTLVQEISSASEPFLIPNVDYNGNQMVFTKGDPVTTSRTMRVAGCFNGKLNPADPTNAQNYQRSNIIIAPSGWQ